MATNVVQQVEEKRGPRGPFLRVKVNDDWYSYFGDQPIEEGQTITYAVDVVQKGNTKYKNLIDVSVEGQEQSSEEIDYIRMSALKSSVRLIPAIVNGDGNQTGIVSDIAIKLAKRFEIYLREGN